MWWYLLQSSVMIAVGWTGIYYQWTPNGYLLGLISIGAAWLVTVAIVLAPAAFKGLKSALQWLFQDFKPRAEQVV
jgi:hypothetical protein